MLFLANFYPPSSLSHFVTHPGTPLKYVTHLGPPIFSRPGTKNPDKSPLYKFALNCSRGVLSECLLSGRFRPGVVFVHSTFCQNTSVRKLNITLNFMFHMYDKKL